MAPPKAQHWQKTHGMSDVADTVHKLIKRARTAQQKYERYNQAQIDEVVTAVGWAIINPRHNQTLAEMAVADTGLGNTADKITKNQRKTIGLLRDLKEAKSVEVIAEYPDKGIVEIARPVGVVGAITPSTNPVATPANMIINALKGGNAIVLSPSPKGYRTCTKLLEFIHEEFARVGVPLDIVQQLPSPTSKALMQELMRQVDLVVVTGSQNNVRAAYSSGTPAIGVGTGNVVVIIDDSADLPDAAEKITRSKTFDNATSCSSENNVVIVESVYQPMLAALTAQGGALVTAAEKKALQQAMWPNGKLNPKVMAKSAAEICQIAGLTRDALPKARFLMVEETDTGEGFPFSGEKLSPVLTVYRARNFDHAFDITRAINAYQGAGHSIGIHTQDDGHVIRLGLEAQTCRVIVNQAHAFATGGSFDNGLPSSLSMGCGTWGKNSISDNLNYRHYLNITRIVRTIPSTLVTEEELFGAYRKKYGLEEE